MPPIGQSLRLSKKMWNAPKVRSYRSRNTSLAGAGVAAGRWPWGPRGVSEHLSCSIGSCPEPEPRPGSWPLATLLSFFKLPPGGVVMLWESSSCLCSRANLLHLGGKQQEHIMYPRDSLSTGRDTALRAEKRSVLTWAYPPASRALSISPSFELALARQVSVLPWFYIYIYIFMNAKS